MAADPFGFGGRGGGEDCGGKGEFAQSFHSFAFAVGGRSSVPAAFAASFGFVHWNSPHPLHRKRRWVSYKNLRPSRGEQPLAGVVTAHKTRLLKLSGELRHQYCSLRACS
jgi:hypothetical protein